MAVTGVQRALSGQLPEGGQFYAAASVFINMKTAKALLLVVLAAILAPMAAWSANILIRGKVTDEKDEPMEFVTVRIAGTAMGATTGLDGSYTLTVPSADTVTVLYTSIGYHESQRQLIRPKGQITLNVKMLPKDTELQTVEVTEIRKQTTSMQNIKASNSRLTPDASGGSIEAMLTTMGGAQSSNEMSSQYRVHGGTYDENSVYINGVEVYRPQLISSGQQEGLSVINPEMVGAIGFSTGGYTAQYGDKMSSVLDITYKQPQAFEGAVSGSLMGGSLTLGQSSKTFSQLYGIRYKSNASLLSSTEDKGEYDPKFFDFQTNISWKMSPRLTASVLGNISINRYNFTPVSRETKFGTLNDAHQFKVYFDGHEKDRFETFFGALNLTYRRSRAVDFSLLASGYLTNELVAYDISGEYWLDQAGGGSNGDGGQIGGELGVGRYMEHARNRLKASVFTVGLRGNVGIARHTLSWGLQFNHENVHDRAREWELRDSAGHSLPVHPDAVKMIYNLDSRHNIASNRFSVFAQDTWRVPTSLGYLNVTGGLRVSHWDWNKETLVSPRINVGLVPDKAPRWAFRMATGLYYQAPFYKEYRMPVTDIEGNTVIELNKDIKSQRAWHFILGADYTFRAFGRPFKVSAEAYYKALSQLIPYEFDNLKIVYTGQNTSKGHTMGVDFKLFGEFVPGSDSWVSLSLMNTQEDLNGVKVPRPTDQRYAFSLYFTDYFPMWPKLKFSLKGILSDGLPTTAPHTSRDKGYFRMPPYKRVDLGVAYGLITPPKDGETRTGLLRHIKSCWLGLDVFNLLDISNVSSYYWVTDVNGIQYAVPNYLTRRQINVRLTIDF